MHDLKDDLRRAATPFGDARFTIDQIAQGARRRGARRRAVATATAFAVFALAGSLVFRAFGNGGGPVDPAASPHDGPIAYVITEEGAQPALRITGVASAVEHVVPEVGRPVAWSQDGSLLVFGGTRDGDEMGLWSVRADGSGLRRLAPGDGAEFAPAFDPSGERLLFFRHGSFALILDLGTGEIQEIVGVDTPGLWADASWSDDGSAVIAMFYGADEGGPNRLVVIPLDGGSVREIYRGSFNEPSTSPDGRTVAIASDGRLVLVATDGSGERTLLGGLDGQGLSKVAWAPVGSSILYTVPIGPTEGEQLWIVDAASGTSQLLAEGLAWRGGAPAWSPDAGSIAFERGGDIWTVEIATGVATQVTQTVATESDPSWGAPGNP
ncbi:MAG: hypothetical protein WD096_07680 [Actinomycetota bacterium]